MAFELPPLPNFQVNSPQMPSPLDAYGKMLQLKQLSGQQQLLPLEVQEQQEKAKQSAIQTQVMQAEADSQKAMVKAWSDPKFTESFTSSDAAKSSGLGFDPDGMTRALISQGVLPKDAMAITGQFIDRSQKISETLKAQAQTGEAVAGQREKGMKILASKIGSILDLPTDKATLALQALKQDLVQNPKAYAGVPQEDLAHVYSADLEHLPAMVNVMGLESQIADFHKAKFDAQAAGQKVIPEGAKMSPDTAQSVQKDIAVATNPQIQRGKEQVAAAEGAARANIEAQMARGSNAALANVPPHLVPAATEAATKAGLDYAQAKSVSDRLTAMMDAAHKGNVVSYQLIPQEGALQVTTSQGVHRINMAEIQNYGGGSLWQRMEGKLGKNLTGKSIPDSVLSDMAEMQKIQQQGARAKYENSLSTINQAYGSTFKPAEMGAGIGGPSVGAIENGYKFKGGDPTKKENWEQVKK